MLTSTLFLFYWRLIKMTRIFNVCKYVFAMICIACVVFMISVRNNSNVTELWLISVSVFVISIVLCLFCANRHPLVRHIFAMICILFVKFTLEFRVNSSDGRYFVKRFTTTGKDGLRHINYNRIYHDGLRAYDNMHKNEVR